MVSAYLVYIYFISYIWWRATLCLIAPTSTGSPQARWWARALAGSLSGIPLELDGASPFVHMGGLQTSHGPACSTAPWSWPVGLMKNVTTRTCRSWHLLFLLMEKWRPLCPGGILNHFTLRTWKSVTVTHYLPLPAQKVEGFFVKYH